MRKNNESVMRTNLVPIVIGALVHAFAVQMTYFFWVIITGV